MKGGWHLDKRIPLGIIGSIIVQSVLLAVWLTQLASATSINTVEIARIQSRQDRLESNVNGIYERLARIEANQDNQLALMQEIRQSLVRR